MTSKSGRRNGSPQKKFTWKTPAAYTCSTACRASVVSSSRGAGVPEADKQWWQRRLQASVTSQVRFTGDDRPCSTKRLLTNETLDHERFQQALDPYPLRVRLVSEYVF